PVRSWKAWRPTASSDDSRSSAGSQTLQFRGEVMGETALKANPRLRIGFEIPLQGGHLPAQRAHRLHGLRVHFGRRTAEHERRADDVSRAQLTEDPSVLRHAHCAAAKER